MSMTLLQFSIMEGKLVQPFIRWLMLNLDSTTTACHSMNISQKYNASYKTFDTSKRRREVCVGKKKKDGTHTES